MVTHTAAIAEMRAKMASERLPYPVDEEVDVLMAEMQGVRDVETTNPTVRIGASGGQPSSV